MDFEIAQPVAVPVDQVIETLLDPRFIASLSDLGAIGAPELVDQERKGDQVRQRVRYKFTASLSPAVTAVVDPDKLSWIDDATFDLRAQRSAHTIEPDHYADRLEARYDTDLDGDGAATTWHVRGVVKVHVLLVGGKVEHAIVDGLRDFAAAEADAIARWT